MIIVRLGFIIFLLQFSSGLKGANRGWVIPPFNEPENSRGPFPIKLSQIKSDYAAETTMTYRITGEGADLPPVGLFKCDKNTGTISVTQPLDRERKAFYNLTVYAVGEGGIKEKPMEIIINVIDQNDNKPVFTQNPFNGQVPETALNDHEFMMVTATDADDPNTDNGDVRYKIVGQTPPLPNPNMFDINTVTGGIRVISKGLDREKHRTYTLLIQAKDMKGEGGATTSTAIITVTDSNDNAPEFDQAMHEVSVPENQVGAVVVKLTVTDGDEVGSPAWSTKYKIISGDKGGFFNVSTGPSQLEGIITTVKPLDYEKTKQYILSVIVENDDPFVLSLPTSTATVTVNVEVNEPPSVTEREIQMCNREAPPAILSITDKDGLPHAGPFRVDTQGETQKNWTARMNVESSQIELMLRTTLEPGIYNVILRVYDQGDMFQDNTIKATVCDCKGQDVVCNGRVAAAGLPLSGVLRILGGILALLLLILLIVFVNRKSH